MKHCLALIALLITTLGYAGNATGSAKITFASTVSLGPDFSGTVSSNTIDATVSQAGDQDLLTMTVDVKVDKMDTDEPKRDKDMRKMMNNTEHPLVKGEFSDIDITNPPKEMPFKITIHGVTKDIVAKVSNWKKTDSKTFSFDLNFAVSLSAHKMKAPRMMFMKVDDSVAISASFAFKPSE